MQLHRTADARKASTIRQLRSTLCASGALRGMRAFCLKCWKPKVGREVSHSSYLQGLRSASGPRAKPEKEALTRMNMQLTILHLISQSLLFRHNVVLDHHNDTANYKIQKLGYLYIRQKRGSKSPQKPYSVRAKNHRWSPVAKLVQSSVA